MQLEEDSSNEGFFGVDVTPDKWARTVTLTLTGLIDKIIKTLLAGCDHLFAVSTPGDIILRMDA